MTLDLTAPVEDLALALVNFESASGHEGPLADEVEGALRVFGHLEVIRDGDAVVARTDLGRAERVAIAGHLDTVPPAGNLPGRIESGVLWGRGSIDMKGGIAAMLALAAEVDAPSRDVTWIFYDQEEVASELSGLGRLMSNHPDLFALDFAVLCEPTAATVEGGCNGTIRLEARVPGLAAHSARPWMGVNAVHAAAPLLEAIAAHDAETVTVDGLDYREGLNVVGIRGGVAGNVIPDECVVTVNYRFAPAKTTEEAILIARAVLDSAQVEGLSVELVDRADPCRPGLNAPLARSLADAAAEVGAGEPRAKLGWTDVARFGARGIAAVNYGPGDPERAHTDDESVLIAQISQVREGLRLWLAG